MREYDPGEAPGPFSWRVKHLLDGLPPRRLAGLAAGGAGDQRRLEPVRHAPPLADAGVRAHLLHVALEVVAHVLEAGEQDAALGIVEDAVCFGGRGGAKDREVSNTA